MYFASIQLIYNKGNPKENYTESIMVAYTWNSVLRRVPQNLKEADKITLHSVISTERAVTEIQKSTLNPQGRVPLFTPTYSRPALAIIIIRIIGMPTLLFCLVLKIFLPFF